MSAHAWVRHPDSETIRRPNQRIRVCTACGKEQEWAQDHEWGRVVRSHWCPKVGRCRPRPKTRCRQPLLDVGSAEADGPGAS